MQIVEQEFFFKDFFIIFSALLGLIILVVIQLKNLGVRFQPIGRRITDLENNLNLPQFDKSNYSFNKDWFYSDKKFKISREDYYLIWYISVFNVEKVISTAKLKNIDGLYWYEMSNSTVKTEKIMAPILRKIIGKYKKQLESEKSIQFLREDNQNGPLFSWLKNESHLHTAVYNFLDECLLIAKELGVKPNLVITLSHFITFEIILPPNQIVLLFEKEIKELYAVDLVVEQKYIKLVLWLAFTKDKIPQTCIKNYGKSNIFSNHQKTS